jgi:hypothetical protein
MKRTNVKLDYNALCVHAWLVHSEAYKYPCLRVGAKQMNKYIELLINGSEDEKDILLSKGHIQDNFFTMLDYMSHTLCDCGFYLVDNETKQFYFSVIAARDALYCGLFGGVPIDYAAQVKQSFIDMQNNSNWKFVEKFILESHNLAAFVRT